MAFLDDLGKKISKTGQSALQKTKDMAEVAKYNSMISDEEKNINNNYYQIGKLYISLHSSDVEEEFKGMIASVRNSESKIADYREQIKLIKGVVRCENCGSEVSINSAFCNSCGAPMPKRVPEETIDSNLIKCEKCGKYVKKGMRFCTSCGSPMPREATEPVSKPEMQIRKCPKCGLTTTDAETLFCNSCGTRLTIQSKEKKNEYVNITDVSINADTSNTNKIKKCPKCGFETDDTEICFCTECGAKLF